MIFSSYHFIFNALKMSQIQFDAYVANGIAIDVAHDIPPVQLIDVLHAFHDTRNG